MQPYRTAPTELAVNYINIKVKIRCPVLRGKHTLHHNAPLERSQQAAAYLIQRITANSESRRHCKVQTPPGLLLLHSETV